MKAIKYYILGLSLLALSMVACSDEWDKHYEEVSYGSGTLWQSIKANNEISNFKEVVEACGLSATLDGSQVCTVFAPTNTCFDDAKKKAIIDQYNAEVKKGVKAKNNTALKEFVKNHIALLL